MVHPFGQHNFGLAGMNHTVAAPQYNPPVSTSYIHTGGKSK